MATFLTVYAIAWYPMNKLLLGPVFYRLYMPLADLFGALVGTG